MTMRSALLVVAALAVALPAAAADRKETLPLQGFHGLDVAVPMDLEVVRADTESLQLEGPAEVMDRIEVVIERGVLRIHAPERPLRWRGKLKGTLHARRIESVVLAGAGSIRVAELRGEAARATISGSGDVRIAKAEARSLELRIAGAGSLDVGPGSVERIGVTISGTGDVKAGRVEARAADVSIAGTGDAIVWARESLDVRIAGVGQVRYYGEPRVQRRAAGLGGVTRLGVAPG